MDPFIEAKGWGDFHDSLILAIKDRLNELLPRRYVARIAERSIVEFIDAADGERGERQFKPDVRVDATAAPSDVSSAATSVLTPTEATLEMEGLFVPTDREILLQIETIEGDEPLVTAIEVLSPSNKQRGSDSWHQYLRKRQAFLEGAANLVEIDLLRGGRRMPMRGHWPDAPYFITVLRKERAPAFSVLAAHYRTPLPVIPIPLLPSDPDVTLALQPLVDTIYERSRYAQTVKYDRPLSPPLPKAEADWVEQLLKAQAARELSGQGNQ
jgi:hypothetical protein